MADWLDGLSSALTTYTAIDNNKTAKKVASANMATASQKAKDTANQQQLEAQRASISKAQETADNKAQTKTYAMYGGAVVAVIALLKILKVF